MFLSSKSSPSTRRFPRAASINSAACRDISAGFGGVRRVIATLVNDAAREARRTPPRRAYVTRGHPHRHGLRLTPEAADCIRSAFGSVRRTIQALREDANGRALFVRYARLDRRVGVI